MTLLEEPEVCLKCGSSDVVDGECQPCAEVLAEEAASEAPQDEPEACPRCGSTDLVDGECQPCAEAQADEDASEAPQDEP